jgi:phosphate ABC transporter phosphate-binding protein
LAFSKWPLLVLLLFTVPPACALVAEQLSQVKKVYVDSFGSGKDAVEMRKQIVDRLLSSHRVEIVPDPGQADAVIKGKGQTWISGHVFLSRSHSARSPVYQGFLSIQVIGKDKEALWSYLVTPSKFSWASVPNDLANQLASKLITALKEKRPEKPSAAGHPEGPQGTLHGAGATFPAPLYQEWFQLFEERNPNVHIDYDAVGSGEGIRRLQEGGIDFAASDMPLSDESMRGSQSVVQLPTVLGAVVPIYNVDGVHETLQFTPETLAGIYLGQIRRWNDPQIRRSNRNANLPDAGIVVVHRSDGSGTTFVWTDYLSKVSPQWKSSVGSGVTVAWPAGIGAEQSEGVAAKVQNTPDSIGYVEFIYAIQHELGFGSVRNAAGRFVRADIVSVAATAAATAAAVGGDLRVSITNAPGSDVYPIASYTWILVPERQEDERKKNVMKELLHWMLTSGQKSCSALGYVPLPPAVVKRALEIVDAIQ